MSNEKHNSISFRDLCEIVETKTGMPEDVVKNVCRRVLWSFMLCFIYKKRIAFKRLFAFDYSKWAPFVRRHKGNSLVYMHPRTMIRFYLLQNNKNQVPGRGRNRYRDESELSLKEIASMKGNEFKIKGKICVDRRR